MKIDASKVMLYVKVIFYIIVIFGIFSFGYGLYSTRGNWSVELAGIPTIEYLSPSEAAVRISLDIYNPSGNEIRASNLWFSVYVDGNYIGEGFVPYVILKPGHNIVNVSVSFNLLDIPCSLAEAIKSDSSVNITVKGYVMFQILLYGKINYRQLIVPFSYTVEKVELPDLPPGASNIITLVNMVCKYPDRVLSFLDLLGLPSFP